MTDLRVGHGYDVHRFAENRKLIIGGVDIDFEFDKQMFIDLYNEKAQYNPVYLREHIEKCE